MLINSVDNSLMSVFWNDNPAQSAWSIYEYTLNVASWAQSGFQLSVESNLLVLLYRAL